MNKKLWLVLFALLFAACSDNGSSPSVANGTGSNAGETEIACIDTLALVDENGNALLNGTAEIWELDESAPTLVRTLVADSTGVITYEASPAANHDAPALQKPAYRMLAAYAGDSLAGMTRLENGGALPKSVTLAKAGVVFGRIVDGMASVDAEVRILGKTASARSGSYTITGLPKGVHFAYVDADSYGSGMYQVTAGTVAVDTTDQEPQEPGITNPPQGSVEASPGSAFPNSFDVSKQISTEQFIRVEDFENWGNRKTLIGQIYGGGSWFESSDSSMGGGSYIQPSIWSEHVFLPTYGSYSGTGIYTGLFADSSFAQKFAGIGFNLGADYEDVTADVPAFYDLSSMESIAFYAKGTGTIKLQLTCKGESGKTFYSVPVELQDKYQEYHITPADFIAANGSVDLEEVNSISFVAEENADIMLDEIRIYGLSIFEWEGLGHN